MNLYIIYFVNKIIFALNEHQITRGFAEDAIVRMPHRNKTMEEGPGRVMERVCDGRAHDEAVYDPPYQTQDGGGIVQVMPAGDGMIHCEDHVRRAGHHISE